MRPYLADIAVSILALSVSFAVMAALPMDVPGAGFTSLGDMSSPAFFPILAAILVGLSATDLLVRSLVQARRDLANSPPGSVSDTIKRARHRFDHDDLKGPAIMLAACIAYMALIHTLGMITASVLVIVALPAAVRLSRLAMDRRCCTLSAFCRLCSVRAHTEGLVSAWGSLLMEVFSNLADGFALVSSWQSLTAALLGLAAGIVIGALPGLTATMAVAVIAPFTFFMKSIIGIPFLLGIYKGAIYGGSIPAITINTPGTAAAAATALDGNALSRKGKGRLALEVSLIASVIADFIATLVLIRRRPPCRRCDQIWLA